MKASVILAHPYEKSFNHAIFGTACETLRGIGATVRAHDLYAEGFDPVLTRDELGKKPTMDPLVELYAGELVDSDLLVFIHPDWWGQPPAIMKGYIDRVIRPPYAYDYDENAEGVAEAAGKLGGKKGIVFNTSNTDEERENAYFNDPLEYIWKRCVFGFCGMENPYRKTFRIVASSSHVERVAWLGEARDILLRAAGEIQAAV